MLLKALVNICAKDVNFWLHRARFSASRPSIFITMADLAALRVNYSPEVPLDIGTLPTKDPLELFGLWFQEARECDKVLEPNAMTIATANKKGVPSARMVLLKGFDTSGFTFFTNYESRKGQELTENPNVALLFYWECLHKQIRIEGTVQKLSPSETDKYFYSRPHGSQIGACVSNQSKPIASHQVLLDKYAELEQQNEISRPEHWGGYLIVPHAIEFWHGQSNRLHRRVMFTRGKREDVDEDVIREGDNGWFYYVLSS